MKKLFSLLLVLMMVCSLSVIALADDTTGTTTLTTEVPDNTPTWTLTVPATMTIPYGDTSDYDIGEVKVTTPHLYDDNNHFLNIIVYASYEAFSDGGGHSIPYALMSSSWSPPDWPSGDYFYVTIDKDHPGSIKLYVNVAQSDWDAVASYPGTYTSVITFTSTFRQWT